jgi:hypothetical protein
MLSSIYRVKTKTDRIFYGYVQNHAFCRHENCRGTGLLLWLGGSQKKQNIVKKIQLKIRGST